MEPSLVFEISPSETRPLIGVVTTLPPEYRVVSEKIAAIRDRLNAAKTRLDPILPNEYQKLSRRADPFIDLETHLKMAYRIEHGTNAWAKLWVLLTEQWEMPRGAPFRTLDIGGMPGAWEFCMEHYLGTFRPDLLQGWTWFMTSYKAVGSTTHLADRFSVAANHPRNVIFGDEHNPAHNGDVTKPDIIRAICARVGTVDFVMGDIGGESRVYNNQELEILHEDFGQLLVALGTLRVGGTMVLKVFTQFEPTNVTLVWIVSGLFEQFRFVKPPNSRARNSEKYIVGRGFRGIGREMYEELMAAMVRLTELNVGERVGYSVVRNLEQLPLGLVEQLVNMENTLCVRQEREINMIVSRSPRHPLDLHDWCRRYRIARFPREMEAHRKLKSDKR